jgi:C4-dicarboxylate-specific signal transduction histidine kinase
MLSLDIGQDQPDDLFAAITRWIKAKAIKRKKRGIAAERILTQQLIINLVLNAFDSVCAIAGGSRKVEVSASPRNPGFLNFAVRNTGTGIERQLV